MKTLAKLFLTAVLILVHCPSIAGQTADGEKPKPEANSQPCFKLLKRDWPQVESGNYPVCRDFEKNLNSFCDEPPPTCERKIHPKFKNLALPKWVELDSKQYSKIIEQWMNHNFETRGVWRPLPSDWVENIQNGKFRLFHTWIDLDRDGTLEHVIRFDPGSCVPGSRTKAGSFYNANYGLAVVDKDITQLDKRYDYLVYKSDIILHESRVYVLKFSDGFSGFSLQEPFSVPQTGGKGSISVCVFQYLK